MFKTRKSLIWTGIFSVIMLLMPALTVYAGGGGAAESEVTVRRVDSNQLIRLRVFLDGKSVGILKVGETAVYHIANGYHTLRIGFEDFEARSTEVAQFTSYNSAHVFSVTDSSIVLIKEETGADSLSPPTPITAQAAYPFPYETQGGLPISSGALDNAIRSAFDKTTQKIKKNKKIAVLNVDSENPREGSFVLEEITLLTVNSPKNYIVIDRRMFDAYRAVNSIDVPTYENDYMLRYIGNLMGADYVLSCILGGPGDLRRLRVKALDVSTGTLIGNSSERL
ncbi:MAG: hypothetical protein LBT01_01530 [Spirochaetaceae bacterium]|jgi:hypothetical protein|nr:hypothetical protein [Spirochaetaceae bacterium]